MCSGRAQHCRALLPIAGCMRLPQRRVDKCSDLKITDLLGRRHDRVPWAISNRSLRPPTAPGSLQASIFNRQEATCIAITITSLDPSSYGHWKVESPKKAKFDLFPRTSAFWVQGNQVRDSCRYYNKKNIYSLLLLTFWRSCCVIAPAFRTGFPKL